MVLAANFIPLFIIFNIYILAMFQLLDNYILPQTRQEKCLIT